MIQIKKLSFSNILCYGANNVFELENTVTQLIGKNGNGKSSLPTILEEALYNKNSRGIKKADLFNRYLDKKSYSIDVEFTVDSDSYALMKKVTASTKVILTKNGEDISGHTTTQTYKQVESILGLDFPSFTKLVYQSMVSSLDFLSSTDANRKKFLTSLLGLEKYVESEKELKDAAKSALLEVNNLKGKVEVLSDSVNNKTVVEVPDKVEIPEVDLGLEDIIQGLRGDLAKVELTNKMISKNNEAINRAQNLQVVEQTVWDGEEELSKLQDKSKTLKESIRHNTQVRTSQKNIVKNSVCPTCKTELKDSTKAVEEIKLLDLAIASDETELDKVESYVRKLLTIKMKSEKYKRYLETLEEINKSIDNSLDTELVDSNALKQEIKEKTQTLENQKNAKFAAEMKNSKIEKDLEWQAHHEKKVLEDEALLSEYSTKLEEANVTHHRLDVVAKAFGSKGLIAYKIESMVKVFEGLINEYLQVLSEGRFALTFVVEDNKLALKLYDNASEIDIKSLSSGELNRVNTATLLAVRKMMSAISKVSMNVLFLDEVISVLDEDGKATLIEVLLKEDMNTVVVSHGYAHPLADKIEIVKEDNIARIEK